MLGVKVEGQGWGRVKVGVNIRVKVGSRAGEGSRLGSRSGRVKVRGSREGVMVGGSRGWSQGAVGFCGGGGGGGEISEFQMKRKCS